MLAMNVNNHFTLCMNVPANSLEQSLLAMMKNQYLTTNTDIAILDLPTLVDVQINEAQISNMELNLLFRGWCFISENNEAPRFD